MPRVLHRDEVIDECRWQPQTIELPDSLEGEIDVEKIAREIHRRAEIEATELLEQARRETENIKVLARDEGYQAGRAQAEQEAAESVAAINALIEEINREREEFFDRSETELVRLSVAIAEKVLAQQLAVKPETVLEFTRTHLKRIRERATVRLRVNPEDLPLLSGARQSFLNEIDGLRNLQLQEDRRVGRGGLILEAPSGTFDARFSTQLGVIREGLEETQEENGEPEED